MANKTSKIRIRMYRVGFGDCFLLSIPVTGGATKHVLIDCGVHPGGDTGMMEQTVADIVKETGQKLALLIVTHNHKDHVSGFAACAKEWVKFDVGEVWLPWTEDPSDPGAAALRTKQVALAAALQKHQGLSAAAAGVLALAGANAAAMKLLREGFEGAKVRYFSGGARVERAAGIAGLNVQILAPPRDTKFLARMDPPGSEEFLRANADGGYLDEATLRPFEKYWEVKAADWPNYAALTEEQKNLLAVAATNAEALAFALDNAMNNTSLVTYMTYGGKNLLFAGDAQYGNWQSWIGTSEAASILSSTHFFKVAHHGSHNATPKSVAMGLKERAYAAMIPTQNKPWASIPQTKLIETVMGRASGAVRSDSLPIAGAPAGPPLAKLPKGFEQGDFWYDYLLPVAVD